MAARRGRGGGRRRVGGRGRSLCLDQRLPTADVEDVAGDQQHRRDKGVPDHGQGAEPGSRRRQLPHQSGGPGQDRQGRQQPYDREEITADDAHALPHRRHQPQAVTDQTVGSEDQVDRHPEQEGEAEESHAGPEKRRDQRHNRGGHQADQDDDAHPDVGHRRHRQHFQPQPPAACDRQGRRGRLRHGGMVERSQAKADHRQRRPEQKDRHRIGKGDNLRTAERRGHRHRRRHEARNADRE